MIICECVVYSCEHIFIVVFTGVNSCFLFPISTMKLLTSIGMGVILSLPEYDYSNKRHFDMLQQINTKVNNKIHDG